MRRKKKNLISFLVIFVLMLQITNLLPTEESLYQTNDNLNILKDNIKTINTLSITYRVDDLNLLNSEISKHNPIYQSYYLEKSQEKYKNLHLNNVVSESAINQTLHLPESFKYQAIDEKALQEYLSTRSSILREEPYFSSIINVSREFNINPILLFAITGQEQSFVPEDNVSAFKIANNPYNVFCSWQSYNTDIIDSSEIACRTIINLSKDRPDSVDPLIWVNKKYSADQNWHYGVRSLYNEIDKFVNN
ncbi:hypothetical protein [Clostridium sp.]|uniref:hypothetical protein n=1 Tax=Clostridium sp. TaxID=1506 RepID=UPI0032171D4C